MLNAEGEDVQLCPGREGSYQTLQPSLLVQLLTEIQDTHWPRTLVGSQERLTGRSPAVNFDGIFRT